MFFPKNLSEGVSRNCASFFVLSIKQPFAGRYQKMPGTAVICCGDRRLNLLVQVLDQNGCYRIRDIGSPFDYVIDQSQLLVLNSKLVGFPPENAPIQNVLVLVHTDCLAIQSSDFFATLREKRMCRYAATHEGDLEFCEKQLAKIRVQTARLSGPVDISWFFGIIDTDKATLLNNECGVNDALNCIAWPFGAPPFF